MSGAEQRGAIRGRVGLQRALVMLAALLPWGVYLTTAGGSSYWLDAGELVAASVALDILHPPGHPLSALYGKAFTWLPLGPMALRVAVGQAFAAAAACALLFVATLRTVRAVVNVPLALALPGAALASVAWSLSFAIWIQAVRPEVYALQAMLLMLAAERIVAFQAGDGTDRRPLYVAALALGLGLANHHVMSVLAMPALLHAALRVTHGRARGLRPVLVCAAVGMLALLTYVYLPLRAGTSPPANLGDPRTLERILWVVSARVYARGVGDEAFEPLVERWTSSALVALDVVLPIGFALAVLGAYALLRRRRSLHLALAWLSWVVTSCVVSPLLNSPTSNPDAMGYMALGLAGLAALAGVGAVVLSSVLPSGGRRWPAVVAVSWLAVGGMLVEHLQRNWRETDLSGFVATDVMDDPRHRDLPPRAAVVATMPQTAFRHQELEVVERVRPDVEVLLLPFVAYPGALPHLARRSPDLTPIARAFLSDETVGPAPLLRLATRRPVLVELGAHVALASYGQLLPTGLLFAVVDPRRAELLRTRATAAQARAYARLDALLGPMPYERETTRQLLWLRYMDALHQAATGQTQAAQASLKAARRYQPSDSQLNALSETLAQAPAGVPIDVTPFLQPGAALGRPTWLP